MHTSCRCLIWCGIITTLDIIIRYQFWYRCLLFEGSPFLFRVYTQPGFVRHLCWRFLNPKITLLYPGFCALPIPSIKKGLPPRCARNNTSRPKPLQPQATIMGCIPNSKKKRLATRAREGHQQRPQTLKTVATSTGCCCVFQIPPACHTRAANVSQPESPVRRTIFSHPRSVNE